MNQEQKKKQKWLTILIIVIVGVGFLAFSYYTIFDHLDSRSKIKKVYATTATLPLDGVDPKEIWVDQLRVENEIVQGKVDFIHEVVAQKLKEESEREVHTKNEIGVLRNEVEKLREELKKEQEIHNEMHLKEELRAVSQSFQQNTWSPFVNAPPIPIIEEVFTPLSSVTCSQNSTLRHVNRTIPTGTTVKAILLSSVDMPCGVQGSMDPLPVKLRVIADGRLPHEVKARLKSGIVTASVYGDLSSERVYFRLERLTQVRPDGHYIETQVAGYVSGEDGKYGVRGTVVDKSCQLIENALLSGFLSGASGFFEAAAMARLYPITSGCGIPEACSMNWGQSAGQLAIAGGTEGVTNALDALTDYFIRRAEQLRPVIQITPGRIVDITFLDCADLGDLYTHERVRNSGNMEALCGP